VTEDHHVAEGPYRVWRSQRLTLMPSRPEDALATLTADGWAEIGVMADPDHSHDWRVWLNLETGAGRLRVWDRR
jgi:S-formylglutathione hydrolase FrmB